MNDTAPPVRRVLSWYSRQDESLLGERELHGVSLEQLKSLVHPSESDPLLYDSYAMSLEASKILGNLVGVPIDPGHCDYFIECEAADGL